MALAADLTGMQHVASPLAPVFPSKRDGWLVGVLWSAALVDIGIGVALMACPFALAVRMAVFTSMLASAALVLWLLYGTSYRIEDDLLIANCGPFRFRVPLAEIDSVTPTRNPLSSPAVSLDRLEIRYGERRLLISPEDQAFFLQTLVVHAPQLRMEGDGLTR